MISKRIYNKFAEFLTSAINKPHVKNILLIILFGALLFSTHIGHDVPTGHDLNFHTRRYMGISRAIQDGQIIPQLDPAMFNSMGYAPSLFYGPLSGYIALVSRLIMPNWNTAINFSVILTVILSGIAMYVFMRKVGKSDTVGLIAGIAYMGMPYHLMVATRRFAAGENLAFVFAPILFLGLWNIIHKDKQGWLSFGIGLGGLILSHNLSTITFVSFAILFAIPYIKQLLNWQSIKQILLGGGICFRCFRFLYYTIP